MTVGATRRMTNAVVLAVVLSAWGCGSRGPAVNAANRACVSGLWPASAEGQPVGVGTSPSPLVYLWHDQGGWKLRATAPAGAPHTFEGSVTGPPGDLTIFGVTAGTPLKSLDTLGSTIRFSFTSTKAPAVVFGFDFVASCSKQLTFDLQVDGVKLAARTILVGRLGRGTTNPLVISKGYITSGAGGQVTSGTAGESPLAIPAPGCAPFDAAGFTSCPPMPASGVIGGVP